MEQVIRYFEGINPILAAFYATLFTWGLTALGASLVFFFKRMNRAVLDGMLGFTGGVMVAASFWSLLAPGIEMSPGEGFEKVIPSAIGFLLGALFLFGLDKILPHLHINFKESEKEGIKTPWHKTTLLTLAITLHNIPEGLAVGVLFGGVAAGLPEATIGATPPAGKGPTRFDGPGKPQKPRSDPQRAQKCDGFISAFGLTSVAGQDCRAKSFNLCDLIGRFPITEE